MLFISLEEVADLVSQLHKGLKERICDTRPRLMGQTLKQLCDV